MAAWFCSPDRIGPALVQNDDNVSASAWLWRRIPILLFALWIGISKSFRHFALSLNPSVLTLAQSWRLIGFTFVLLEARGVLPAIFALPAGYGDMFIGATATYAALKLAMPVHRTSFILWQALGILDLVLAVSLGTTARLISPQGPSMVAMTVLPLSLVPTFLVPLFLIFHLISIAQAMGWKRETSRLASTVTPGLTVV